jgi:hypothetical protein
LDLFPLNFPIILTTRITKIAKRISPDKLKEGITILPSESVLKFHRHKRLNRAGWPKAPESAARVQVRASVSERDSPADLDNRQPSDIGG